MTRYGMKVATIIVGGACLTVAAVAGLTVLCDALLSDTATIVVVMGIVVGVLWAVLAREIGREA